MTIKTLSICLILSAAALGLASCAVGPDYQRPTLEMPLNYAGQQWVTAAPADAKPRADWWTLFDDPTLNTLEDKVLVSNQNIAAAQAAYDQARAILQEQRAAMFPSVNLTGDAERDGNSGTHVQSNKYQVGIGGSWEPDVWGRLRRASSSASASAQASAADLAAARLSAQGELASSYFSLRATDTQYRLLQDTVTAYERALTITQNRYKVGAAALADTLQAQTQLANARADLLSMQRQREQYEHAIAVLVGQTPESFQWVVNSEWQGHLPEVPLGMPSELLQRRPDVAGAERRVAAANDDIGVAKAGYFPSFKLSANDSSSAARRAALWDSDANIWSLGLSLTQSLFDAGATRARVASARASHAQATARYRQTVLSALADVENQLTAIHILSEQYHLRVQAAQAAGMVEQQAMNRYRAGQISYADVVSAQTSALSAKRSLAQAVVDNQTARVALIQALGGGWQVP